MPVGEQTDEILDLVYRVSRETFKISSRNHLNLLESCEKHKIPCPGEFWAQYFPCYSAADYDMVLRAYRSKCSFHNCNQTIAIFSMDGISSTKYVLAAKEKVDVLIRNGFLPENYTKTVAYKTKLMIARGKAVITQMVHDTPVEKALRAAYKKHVKHYRKI